ncbi:uncharacterized protein LOC123872825 isoform X1 [Maniola jurtina]|uniref:uncharacterized protein LOC123872825 isoform X1 n=1 Tax=Maniola jurtina TaxID=191418 RepID=UPI001E6876A0|nr:uncharacterized protein LOC123872825 isoform X1 [Maniola jurtina]
MYDPWDVKSVRQSNQYMSCMKINGVPLLPPVLSKECRKEMQYYKLLAKEVEKRIQTLRPLITESDTESSDDKTDAPDLPDSEHSYELSQDDVQSSSNANNDKVKAVTTEKCLDDCEISRVQASNTFDNITSNFDTDSTCSKLSSKFVIDLSLSVNETGKNLLDSQNSPADDLPERDCDCPQKETKVLTNSDSNNGFDSTIKDEKLSFSVSINKNILKDPSDAHFNHNGPSSLSSKSFTGSLDDIHMESIKTSQAAPLVRQRSYTVLIPSPMLLAHLEVQSINTGVEVTSISMSESLSNISNTNKKRRSWDLESAKQKWSSMALELKKKNIISNSKSAYSTAKNVSVKPVRKVQSTQPKARSLAQERLKRSPPKSMNRSEPIQKPKKAVSPIRNSHPAQNTVKTPATQTANHKKEMENKKQKPISESEDPATRVRELYEKIQKQQLIQMANLVEKQKKEQMLLQQVFEEQNNLLFTQLKTICPKSPNEVKEAWPDKNSEIPDRGPVSLSQVINHKPQQNTCDSPVLSTLNETNNYLNYCDNILKKSRDITGSIKKQTTKNTNDHEKIHSSNQPPEGSRTRTHSPVRKNTPTSRKLTYETSASSDREYDPILTDRTNDTMADLNVTFPSDHSEECQPFMHNSGHSSGHNTIRGSIMESPLTAPVMAASCRSTDRAIRSMEETIQNSINSMCCRTNKKFVTRPPTAQERAAATKIVAYAKGYLVRRLMKTERVQATVQTIKDALLCALQLHQDREGIRGADVDLHRRLIQQITAACYSLHDTFVASSAEERCALIAADRSRRRLLAARLSPAPLTPSRPYRPADVMSHSHSGAFPARAKRLAPSLMTQSNYETFSGDKSVRRYMPSPRRRPWR